MIPFPAIDVRKSTYKSFQDNPSRLILMTFLMHIGGVSREAIIFYIADTRRGFALPFCG